MTHGSLQHQASTSASAASAGSTVLAEFTDNDLASKSGRSLPVIGGVAHTAYMTTRKQPWVVDDRL